jgi:hypothetical protein
MKSYRLICCPFIIIIFRTTVFANPYSDTIYYNLDWSICEQPIAHFFRVGELNTQPYWYFKDQQKDFYINGKIEMEGQYSHDGFKNGIFTFYYSNGKIKKQGGFEKDEMKGIWSYYRGDGSLYFQLYCINNKSFTPLFILGQSGDTLLKNGSGNFQFSAKDYPEVFNTVSSYFIEGQCSEGKKEGKWNYYSFLPDKTLLAVENYKKGIFKNGKHFSRVNSTQFLNDPVQFFDLRPKKFTSTETFALDHVFVENRTQEEAQRQMINFLFYGQTPLLVSQSASLKNNIVDYINQTKASIDIKGLSEKNSFWNHIPAPPKSDFEGTGFLLGYIIQCEEKQIGNLHFSPIEPLQKRFATINFSLLSDGTLSDIQAKGNFDKNNLSHLVYYLSRLTNLIPQKENNKAIDSSMQFYLFTRATELQWDGHKFVITRLLLSLYDEKNTKDDFDKNSFRIIRDGGLEQILFTSSF